MENYIKHYRLKKGWTQKELAERAELSYWWINHMERGTKKAGMRAFEKVADELDVTVGELFTPPVGKNDQKEVSND